MAIKRRARGRSSHGRRGHDACMSFCQRSRGGFLVATTAAVEESFLGCNFSLEVLSPITSRIFLPCSFAMFIFELGLSGLWMRPLGYSHLRSWVKLQVDSCCLVWLDAAWKVFSLCLEMQADDNLCCRFNGEDTLFVR